VIPCSFDDGTNVSEEPAASVYRVILHRQAAGSSERLVCFCKIPHRYLAKNW
jgi:hypothetical protein